MRLSIKHKISLTAIIIIIGSIVYAGSFNGEEISVVRETANTWKGEASGSLSTVVASQEYGYIGCGLKIVNSNLSLTCNARNGSGVFIYGQSTNQNIIKAGQAISAHSYIHFWVDDNGNITRLNVTNSSEHIYVP